MLKFFQTLFVAPKAKSPIDSHKLLTFSAPSGYSESRITPSQFDVPSDPDTADFILCQLENYASGYQLRKLRVIKSTTPPFFATPVEGAEPDNAEGLERVLS